MLNTDTHHTHNTASRSEILTLEQAEAILHSVSLEELDGRLRPLKRDRDHAFRVSHEGMSLIVKAEQQGITDPQNPATEYAAAEFSKALGFAGLVPPTRLIKDGRAIDARTGKFKAGSLALALQCEVAGNNFAELGLSAKDLPPIVSLFDLAIGDLDRTFASQRPNLTNAIRRWPDGRTMLIDFSLACNSNFEQIFRRNHGSIERFIRQVYGKSPDETRDFFVRLRRAYDSGLPTIAAESEQHSFLMTQSRFLIDVAEDLQIPLHGDVIADSALTAPLLGNREALAPVPELFSLGDPTADKQLRRAEHERLTAVISELIRDGLAEGGPKEGLVLDLRAVPEDKEIILVGDLHADQNRFDKLNAVFEPKLKHEGAYVIYLGDLIHSEDLSLVRDMKPSIEIMRKFWSQKLTYPRQTFALLGNHDPLNSGASRGTFGEIDQSALYLERLNYYFGHEYVEQYRRYIELCPLVLVARDLLAMHAGPVTGSGIGSLKAIDTFTDVEYSHLDAPVREVLWGKGDRSLPSQGDVIKCLKNFGLTEDSHLVSGHRKPRGATAWCDKICQSMTVISASGHGKLGYASLRNGRLNFVTLGETLDQMTFPLWDERH